MTKKRITKDVLHKIPADLQKILASTPKVQEVWDTLTPLARNEWICWIESAKKLETKDRRTKIMLENLLKGKRRPCCFAGCTHR